MSDCNFCDPLGQCKLDTRGRCGGSPFLTDFEGKGVVFSGQLHPKPYISPNGEFAVATILAHIGESSRPGLKETPTRVMKAWEEWTAGYNVDPALLLKTFEDGADGCDEMVIIRGIPFYSHCEHHMAAIFGTADVGYIPAGRIVGLSKIPRVVEAFARRLQVQERLTNQIADCINDTLTPKGVAVRVTARHMCMESRGINRPGTETITSALRGAIRTDAAARAEFFSLVNA